MEDKKDDDFIDFSKIKNGIKNFFKEKGRQSSEPKQEHHQETVSRPESGDSFVFDFKSIKEAASKHSKWIIPLIFILLAVSVSVYFRTMPLHMPITNDLAENTITNFYKNQLQSQIGQQYPNLPPQNVGVLVENEWRKVQEENKNQFDLQKKQLAEQYQARFRDDQGTVYLLGIDPYYYYRQTEYVLKNGFPGTSIKEGKMWDDYRLAPLGREAEWNFHHWFGAWWHRFLNLFGDFPLMFTFFLVGTFFSALTVIPGFFIGKRITKNNAGGFFVAMLLAVSPFFVSRTTGESSDTDVYAVFFPVLIAWLFLEAMEAKEKKWKLVWIVLAGITTGVFAFAWTGWWYIATFISATLVLDIVYTLITNKKAVLQEILPPKGERRKFSSLSLMAVYGLITFLSVGIFTSFHQFVRLVLGPLQFIRLKAVAVTTYWPNIRTTVAELNVVSFSQVISQLNGNFLFALALVGIVLVALRKNEEGKRSLLIPFFLGLWLAASMYATTKGVRFILQTTPAFSIALGCCLGLIWGYGTEKISKMLRINYWIVGGILFLLLSIPLIEPTKSGYSQAFNSLPSMNDIWYNSLTKIKNEAPKDVIITSWWDFGHWFKAIADRPVTFDGGTQTSYGAYWVGKSLLVSDEKSAVGIIRMLNCGQNKAFDTLNGLLENETPESVNALNEIVALEKIPARKALMEKGLTNAQAESVLKYTHCDNPPESIYITSEDMIGKSGVWGHFGSWDFRRAVMYKETKNLKREDAVKYLTSNFNLSAADAAQVHSEIVSTEADHWISPWPGYLSGPQGCDQVAEKKMRCAISVQGADIVALVDLDNFTVLVGNAQANFNSLVYPTEDGVVEKELEGRKMGLSLVLIPAGDSYNVLITHPLQAGSMFTKLFFLDGRGLRCFSEFDHVEQGGAKIVTWNVDYECK